MKVSVLVAVYNTRQYLRQCLESLRCQTHRDIEVIMIDDCSTDGSLAVEKEYADLDPRFLLIEQPENRGQAVARNEGLKIASGHLITFLDSDAWFDHDAIDQAVKAFEQNPETDCVLFCVNAFQGTDIRPLNSPSSGPSACLLSIDWRIHGIYVGRASLFKQWPYDTACRYFSDDNTTRIHYLHSRSVMQCQGIYNYRRHPESGTCRMSVRQFDHVLANLSLKRQLEQHLPACGLSDSQIRDMLNTLEMMRLRTLMHTAEILIMHRGEFSAEELRVGEANLRTALSSFEPWRIPWRLRLRFGYMPIRHYRLFMLQETIFWKLRQCAGLKNNR